MKKLTFKLLAATLVIFTFALTSCHSDDDDIEISSFVGTWSRNFNPTNDPNLAIDASVKYTFNADSTWSRHDVYIGGGETTVNGEKYMISVNKYGSLYVDMADYPHLYANPNNVSFEIIKLNAKSMVWKVTEQDENNDFVYYTWYFTRV